MITHDDIARAEYIVSTSGAFEVLRDGIQRSAKGRKSNDRMLELLCVGLLLSIQDRGVATVQGAFRTLTREIPLDEQLRLGVLQVKEGKTKLISVFDVYNQANRINVGLAYGDTSTPGISDEERIRRHQVIVRFSNTLMDAFELGWNHKVYALDATGVWSWARGGKRRAAVAADEVEDLDPEVSREFVVACTSGIEPQSEDGKPVATKPRTPTRAKRRLRAARRAEMPVEWKSTSEEGPVNLDRAGALRIDDGLGYTLSADPDGDWGVKTSKSGKPQTFFGYHEHSLVLAPDTTIEKDRRALPALVRRLEFTPASKDVVDVSLRLIRSLGGSVKDLLVDSHYH